MPYASIPLWAYPLAGVILGLIIGSFLATLVGRWPKGKSVLLGRSECDHCGHILTPMELVPVLSHLLQAGTCNECGTKIGSDHLVIELAAGLIGGLALYVSPGMEGLLGAIFGWFLLTLAALDAQHQWLPDRLTLLMAAFGLITAFWIDEPSILVRIIGGSIGFLVLFVIAAGYRILRGREGLGGGDPKLLGAIGCWLGWAPLPLVLLGASLIGLATAVVMRMRGEPVSFSSALPLGSFMSITAFPIWLYQAANGGSLFLP